MNEPTEFVEEEEPRWRSPNNTRKWCRGKRGTPHDKQVRYGRVATLRMMSGHDPCGAAALVHAGWSCGHEEFCDRCGKVLRWFLPPKECPHYVNSERPS